MNYNKKTITILLELLTPYIKEQEKLFKRYNKELLSLVSNIELTDFNSTLDINECLEKVNRYQYGYNAGLSVVNKLNKASKYAKEEQAKNPKTPFLPCNISAMIKPILESEEYIYVIKDIAFAYYELGKLNKYIGEGIPSNCISIGICMDRLLLTKSITETEYMLNSILLLALLQIDQFRQTNRIKENKIV